MEKYSDYYIKYCRPSLGKLLKAIRMDICFTHGKDNYLYYKDASGNERKVLDLLGGFGTGIFGHHNFLLNNHYLDLIKNNTPFNTQGSCRSKSAILAKKLSNIMLKKFKRNYISTFTNSGSETVEAAIKHSQKCFKLRIKNLIFNLQKKHVSIKNSVLSHKINPSKEELSTLREKLKIKNGSDFIHIYNKIKQIQNELYNVDSIFISLEKGFHGQTCGAVQLTHYFEYRQDYETFGPKVIFIKPDAENLKTVLAENTIEIPYLKILKNKLTIDYINFSKIAALFIEPIQGEGGIHSIDVSFLKSARELADIYKFHLVFDEIQSGMGRTGDFLNCFRKNVRPDYCLMAKSLGGGLVKIGVLLIDEELYNEDFGYLHNTTFVEDDISSSIAIKAVDILIQNPHIMKNCYQLGNSIISKLKIISKNYPEVIKEVRGEGMMIGIEFCRHDNSPSRALRVLSRQNLLVYIIAGYFLHEHNIRIAPTMSDHCTMRILPSAFITEDDLCPFFKSFEQLCKIIQKLNMYRLTRYIVSLEYENDFSEIIDYRNSLDPAGTVINNENLTSVGFINHFIKASDMKLWDQSFEEFPDDSLDEFIERTWSIMEPCVYDEFLINSENGNKVIFKFVAVPISSKVFYEKLRAFEVDEIRNKIEDAFYFAANEEGCSMVGFGGYTSIYTRNCKSVISDKCGATTGNAYTVAAGIESLILEAKNSKIELTESCFGAVGAAGNIGSVYCEIMADYVNKIILITRAGGEKKLNSICEKIYEQQYLKIKNNKQLSGIANSIANTKIVKNMLNSNFKGNIGKTIRIGIANELKEFSPIKISSDMNLLKNCNLILGASNSDKPIIFPNMISDKGPVIICDISVPLDTDISVSKKCNNVLIIRGGIIELPNNPNFKVKGINLDYSQSFSCMAETMILGLSEISNNFSYGEITKFQVETISKLAKKHGFKIARPKCERSY